MFEGSTNLEEVVVARVTLQRMHAIDQRSTGPVYVFARGAEGRGDEDAFSAGSNEGGGAESDGRTML